MSVILLPTTITRFSSSSGMFLTCSATLSMKQSRLLRKSKPYFMTKAFVFFASSFAIELRTEVRGHFEPMMICAPSLAASTGYFSFLILSMVVPPYIILQGTFKYLAVAAQITPCGETILVPVIKPLRAVSIFFSVRIIL